MRSRAVRRLVALGAGVVLAVLYGLSRELLPHSNSIGFVRAVIVAICIWALILWIRPDPKR